MESQCTTKNDENFESLLKKFMNGECSKEEKERFLDEYVYTNTPADFHYVKKAADNACIQAYAPLADRYAHENGCPEDWVKAFQYWNLSVQNGRRGYAGIGDCYRLGKGTEKNYDKAWAAYEKALEKGEERNNAPSIQELLLLDNDMLSLTQKLIDLDWLKYAVKRQTKGFSYYVYCAIATTYFKETEAEYFYWMSRAADAGGPLGMCTMFRKTTDTATQEELIKRIYSAEDDGEGAYDVIAEFSKELIQKGIFEKQAVHFLDNGEDEDCKWLFEYYRTTGKDDRLEGILRELDFETERESEIPSCTWKKRI